MSSRKWRSQCKVFFPHILVSNIHTNSIQRCGQSAVLKRPRRLFSCVERDGESQRFHFFYSKRAQSPFSSFERFTDEEVKQLKKMQQIHGNNWAEISKGMGRSVYSIQKRFSMMSKACTQMNTLFVLRFIVVSLSFDRCTYF